MEKLKDIEQPLREGYKKGGKLIRDGIVSNEQWRLVWFRKLPSKLFQIGLANKLVEEVREGRRVMRAAVNDPVVNKPRVLEEFGDQLTVMETFVESMGWDWEEVLEAQIEKDQRMGRFKLRKFGLSIRRENEQAS